MDGTLPAGSPFPSVREARRSAGPLPFTFDYERESNAIVAIEARRTTARARRLALNHVAAENADFRHLPVPTGTIDAALLLLSAHELRTDETRGAPFAELRRVLGPGGRVVVAEHLRWRQLPRVRAGLPPLSLAAGLGALLRPQSIHDLVGAFDHAVRSNLRAQEVVMTADPHTLLLHLRIVGDVSTVFAAALWVTLG